MNCGSLDSASCFSETSASASSSLAWCVPAARLSWSAGAGLGTAPAAGTVAGAPTGSGPIGVTGLAIALDWSGGAAVASAMSRDCPALPSATMPLISPLTSAVLPDSLYLSAWASVLGVFAAIAASTAAMNAFLSKLPGRWASIVSALAALACEPTSLVGGIAASWASFAFADAGACARACFAVVFTLPVTATNAGSSSGRTSVGFAGGW